MKQDTLSRLREVITFRRLGIKRVWVANPDARGQLNRENENFPIPVRELGSYSGKPISWTN